MASRQSSCWQVCKFVEGLVGQKLSVENAVDLRGKMVERLSVGFARDLKLTPAVRNSRLRAASLGRTRRRSRTSPIFM